MPQKVLLTHLLVLFFFSRLAAQNSGVISFDNSWSFYRGAIQGAERPDFDASKWRKVNLPHDWSIEDLPGTSSPFTQNAISQVSGGFTVGGTGWYRKPFIVPKALMGKHILIQFDGVYMNPTVFVNGKVVGSHPYGYTSFCLDITSAVKYGEKNLIAVEVKNEGQNSRWYSGSGIYRHVWFKITDAVHIAQWGAYITTPKVSVVAAKVNVNTRILNESGKAAAVRLITKVLDQSGSLIKTISADNVINAHSAYEFNQDATIADPQLWSCDEPVMYTAVSEIYRDGRLTGIERCNFGLRKLSFDVSNGFQLNGKTIKLKGGCFHHDNGPLGAKAYDRAEERKVELLKASGFNAIRCSHNPPSPAFLDACDRLGMLVIDEAFDMWKTGKNPYDYHLYFNDWWKKDIESMVSRDRNHPSIIMWSIGNEIPERATADGVKTARLLAGQVRELDATRPITSAVNDPGKEDKDAYFAQLNIGGYNYAAAGELTEVSVYEKDHARIPNRLMVGTESYPLEAFNSWMEVVDHSYVIGDFVWTAYDYIGEASIGWLGYEQQASFYPWNLAYCGDIDICGWKRPQSYYRDALWKDNQLSIFVTAPKPSFALNPKIEPWSKWNWFDDVADWNWKGYEGETMSVNVYSSCEKVELFLNNVSLGKRNTNRSTRFMATWGVPYQPGTLTAIGYNGTKKVNTAILRTAAEPVKIKLTADRSVIKADNQDLCYITVEIEDAGGNIDPRADNPVHFAVEGPATIAGVGNANPQSIESYQRPQRKAWHGKCLVILKSTGKPGNIFLKAAAEGLPSAKLLIHSSQD